MKAWTLFYADVLPGISGVPSLTVDHCLRNAAIEFCERSRVHVVTLTAIDSVVDQMSYPIIFEADTELVRINSVRFDGEKLTPKSPLFLEGKYDDWESEKGTPEHYTQGDTANIMLVPAPNTAVTGGIRIRAAIKPTVDATGVHDWLYSQYRAALAAGARAQIFAIKDQVWTNETLAEKNKDVFEAAIACAMTAGTDGHVRAIPRFSGSFV